MRDMDSLHSSQSFPSGDIEMLGGLKVLSVGSSELTNLVRGALIHSESPTQLVAESFWDLCSHSLHEGLEVSIAVIKSEGNRRELEGKAQQIRRRWPHAGILLVCSSPDALDDHLYDERVPAGISPQDLLTAIRNLDAQKQGVRKMIRVRQIKFTGQRHHDPGKW